MENWFIQIGLKNNYLVKTLDTRYSNDKLSVEWIQYFYHQTAQYT